MTFEGFPRQTISLLQELNANNSRKWLEAHRKDYGKFYLAPAFALIETLAPVARSWSRRTRRRPV